MIMHLAATLTGGSVPEHIPGAYPNLSCCGGPVRLVPATHTVTYSGAEPITVPCTNGQNARCPFHGPTVTESELRALDGNR